MLNNEPKKTEKFQQQKLRSAVPGIRMVREINWKLPRKKRGWVEYSFARFGLVTVVATVLVMVDSKKGETITNVWPRVGEMPEASPLVNLTLVEAAAAKGAVCLDGTLPGYHLDRGYGPGSNSWVIHLEGGGWCNDLASCAERKSSNLGSSLYMERQIMFTGILSNKPSENPDFYNWNRAKVRYCDGASYSGDVEDENKDYKLFFRGQRIWQAIMDDLLNKGMEKADEAFLSGCSAGGLASFLHCDKYQELLPQNIKVKCLGDAGFFLDMKDVSGVERIKSFYNEVVTLQGVANHLPKSCISQLDPTKCFFPQYFLSYINTPFFILNPAYDSWQIQNILAPDVADPQGHWHNCKLDIRNCTQSQLETLQDFRTEMLHALEVFEGSGTRGMFINSCFYHCQTETQETWFSSNSPRLDNKTIAEAIGDWYFDRMPIQNIDCPYPCDSTCHNLIFKE